LFEEFSYDEDGNPRTANFTDYAFPSAAELPSFELRAPSSELRAPRMLRISGVRALITRNERSVRIR